MPDDLSRTPPAPAWAERYADRAARMQASEIRELLKLLDQPDIISFAGGIPDPALFPLVAIRAAYDAILGDPATVAQALQYSVSEGYRPLREWITRHMAGLGVPCGIDNVVITCGSQQGLDFLGKLFLSAGDTALVTAPTYLGALQAFNPYQPRYDRLCLEGNQTPGLLRQSAEQAGSRVRLAYIVPDFANPSGETLSRAQRERLLDCAAELDIPLIEDAAYRVLRYEGEAETALLALEVARVGSIERARTLYCGTFSKIIAPALRVGWVCGAAEVVQKLVLVKQAADLHSATINQMVMHRVAEAVFERQVARIRVSYRERRDAMLAALARHMPPGVQWTHPQGGMFVWVTLPEGMDAAVLLAEAVRDARVAFVPGQAFFADGSGANTLRMNFSLPTPAQIEAGVARLGRLIAQRRPGG